MNAQNEIHESYMTHALWQFLIFFVGAILGTLIGFVYMMGDPDSGSGMALIVLFGYFLTLLAIPFIGNGIWLWVNRYQKDKEDDTITDFQPIPKERNWVKPLCFFLFFILTSGFIFWIYRNSNKKE